DMPRPVLPSPPVPGFCPLWLRCYRVALPGYFGALQPASEWLALYVKGRLTINEVVRRLREPDGKVQVWVDGDSMETKPRLDGEPGLLMFAKDDTRALGAVGVREQG